MAGGVNVGTAYGEVIISTLGVQKSVDDAKRALSGLESGFMRINPIMGLTAAGLLGIGAAAGGLVGAIGSSVGVTADLEAQLDGVQAVLGATSGEMGQLKALISDLGIDPKLKVSSLEAAQAVELLARNGLTTQQILDGAARSTVLLANATGADFGLSANIATDAMAQFGIQAAGMEQAVDGITSVVNNSKFGIQDYQLALAQGGGVAASVGVEFDDFNTAIAAISPLFASGSDAGTSFKTFLQRLIPQSKEAATMMQQLGMEFFYSNGRMKSMAKISGELQAGLSGLSEEQRNNALSTIFGTDAMRAAVGLAKKGETGFKALQTTMADTSAADAAAARMDNLAGAMDIFGGIVETIQIAVGDEFIPVITNAIRTASDLLNANTGNIVGFFSDIAAGTEEAAAKVRAFAQAFAVGFAVGGDGGGLMSFLGGLKAGLLAIVPPETVPQVAAVMGQVEQLGQQLLLAKDKADQFVQAFTVGFGAEGGGVSGFLGGLKAGLLAIVPPEAVSRVAAVMNQVNSLLTALQGLNQFVTAGGQIWSQFSAQISTAWGPASAMILDAINRIMTAFGSGESQVASFGGVMGALGAGVLTAFKLTLDAIVVGLQLAAIVISGTATAIENLTKWWNDWFIALGVIEEPLSLVDLVLTSFKLNLDNVGTAINFVLGSAREFFDEITALKDAILGLGSSTQGWLTKITNLGKALGDLALPDWLTPGSPAPLQYAIEGVSSAMGAMPDMGQIFGGAAQLAAVPDMALNAATASPVSNSTSNTWGDIGITINGGSGSPQDIGREVDKRLRTLFGQAQSGRV